MTTTRKFESNHGTTLYIRADFAQASSTIEFSQDGQEFFGSPFQVADARHRPLSACKLIAEWSR